MSAEKSEPEAISTVAEEGDTAMPAASPSPELEDQTSPETTSPALNAAEAGSADPAETVAETAEPQFEKSVQENESEATEKESLAATPGAKAERDAEVAEIQTEATPEETVSIPQDDRAWYVIHCYSGHENKVKYNLEQRVETMQLHDQIFQTVVPTEDEIEVRGGKRRTIERRVFPGYILVQMILNDDSWYAVRNTPGVTGFVGMGNKPTPLRTEEVQAILKRMEADAPKIKVTFKKGQKVRIIDGPFNEFIGMVDEIDMERAKVRVMVSFFGRETPVELDFLQVEKM